METILDIESQFNNWLKWFDVIQYLNSWNKKNSEVYQNKRKYVSISKTISV